MHSAIGLQLVEEPTVERNDSAAPTADQTSAQPVAQALYRARRTRDRIFDTGLFSEPMWDVLLDLFIAEKARRSVSITSAFIAAAAPTTTAMRCLKQLEALGLVYRERDPVDRRRTNVRLSAATMGKMEQALSPLCSLATAPSRSVPYKTSPQ